MTDTEILRTKFRERIQSKTSWGRNELMLVLEEAITDMYHEQLSRMYEEKSKVNSAPVQGNMNDLPF